MDNLGIGALIAGGVIFSLFIAPFLTFWLAYFGGWIAKLVIGKQLVAAFAMFGLIIPIDKIPLITGLIGWIGSYFKDTVKVNKN